MAKKLTPDSLLSVVFLAYLFFNSIAFAATSRINPADQRNVEIDRIEFEGITVFTQSDIEPSLEITAGDHLDRSKIIKTAENLRDLYQNRGYDEIRIKTELTRRNDENNSLETVLVFKLIEGRPLRIKKVMIVPEIVGNEKKELNEYWRKYESQLLFSAAIKPGDIFDQSKIAAAKRAIQDVLASDEFVGVKVTDRVVGMHNKPDSNILAKNEPTSKWVDLELKVFIGDRVTFGFKGNMVLSRGKLTSLIDDQRAVGLGGDYITAIGTRIENEYKSIGYAWVKVSPFTFEKHGKQERHVTFQIHEGPRVIIESLDFDGNFTFSNEELIAQFYAHSSPLVKRKNYVEKDVEKSAELLVEWLKSQGYLSAKLLTIGKTITSKNKGVRLLVYIYEGEQTLVQSLKLPGMTVFTEDEVVKMLGNKEGRALNLFTLNEGIEVLKQAYRKKGFLEARVTNEGTDTVVRYSRENRFAEIKLEIDEGAEYRVSRIEIEGLTKTKEEVVKRELRFKEGGILEEPLIIESEARLRKIGIFSNVSIKTEEDREKPGHKIVKVSAQEGTPGILAGGPGFRNDLGIRVFGQAAYTNVWHRNHTVFLNGSANHKINEDFCSNRGKRARTLLEKGYPIDPSLLNDKANCFTEYQVQLGYTWPWFMMGETTFRPVFTIDRRQFLMFDTASVAFDATLERRLLRSTNLMGALTYSLERTEGSNSAEEVDNQVIRIGSLTPSLRLDLRDNSLAPSKGFYSSTSFEYAGVPLGSRVDPYPVSYTRWQFRADSFVPIGKEIVWFLSVRTGIEWNLAVPPGDAPNEIKSQYQIPIFKQFSLGGAGSLRGFSEQELNVQHMAILGTLSYVNYRTQIDFPFAGPLRFGPFLDAGNLIVDRYSLGMLRYGAGVGFHYKSPVGSVNFDWGFKVDPKPGEDPNFFYFSIGSF